MKNYLLALVIIASSSLGAQELAKGTVVSILSTNKFKILGDNNKEKIVIVYDTEPITSPLDKYTKALDYLTKNILNKEIYVFIKKVDGDTLTGSIIYNCVDSTKSDQIDFPCSSADPLDIKLIENGFVKYIGNNEFLKKRRKGVKGNIPN